MNENVKLTDNRIKVCIIAPVHNYSDIRVFQKEAKTLRDEGYDIVLFAKHDKDEVIDGVKVKKVTYRNRMQRFLKLPSIFKVANKLNADIYHLHNPDTLLIGFWLKKANKVVIYDTHEDFSQKILIKKWLPKIFRKPIAKFVSKLENKAGTKFNSVIVTEEQVKNRISNEAIIIGNPPIIKGRLISDSYKESKKVEKDDLKAIYVGGISKGRGILQMINSIEKLNDKLPIKLWLIGPFFNDELYKECLSLTGWQYVEYLGKLPQEQAFAHMIKADVGLATLLDVGGHSNTDPNKIYEYQVFGLPYVASNFPKWVDRFSTANSGIFVDPIKEDEIVDSLYEILTNDKLYEHMSRNGKKFTEDNSWDKEKQKLIEIYKSNLED